MAKPKQRLKEGVTVGPTGVVSIANDGAGIAQDTINKVGEYNANITGGKAVSPTTPTISPKLQQRIDAQKLGSAATSTAASAVGTVAQPIQPVAPVAPIDESVMDTTTGKPVSEATTPIAPVAPITPVEPPKEPEPVVTTPEVKPEPVEPIKPVEQPEPSDVEKNAQATGIQYTMKDGQPVYNPTTKEEAMKVLQMGGKVATETKLSKIAQTQLDKVRNLGQLSDKNLSQKIVKGEVSAKDLEMLGVINPELVAKAKELSAKANITNNANAIAQDNNNIVNGVDAPIQNTALNTLLKKLEEIDTNKETYAEIKARVYENYPDMENARNEIVTAQTELRQLQRNKRDLFDDYKAQNSGLPISMIMAGYSALSRNLDDAIYEVNDTLSQNVSLYNSYLEEANAEIDWEINNEKAQEERLWQMYGVTRAEEVRSEDIQREDARIEQSIALEEARYERDIERQDMVSARERQQRLDDLKMEQDYNLSNGLLQLGIDSTGMTPEEMKAEYASAVKAQAQAAAKAESDKLAKGNWTIEEINGKKVRVNKDTGEVLAITSPSKSKYGFTPTNNGMKVNIESTEDIPEGRRQCGAYANDSLNGGPGWMGDSLESKMKNVNSDTPVPGSAFVMDFGDGEQPGEDGIINGHTGVVEEVTNEGIWISDSNRQSNEEFRRVFVPYDSKEYSYMKGFAIPPQSELEQETQQYTDIQEVQLPEKATEFSKKSFGFAVRMSESEKAIKNMEEKFKKSTSASEWLGGKYPNWMKTDDRQAFDQSKRNFVNAVLRNESGAVISDQEFANADKQYFPQPGDTKEVMNQKAQNRRTALLNMFNSAGKTETGESIKDIYNSIDITNSY